MQNDEHYWVYDGVVGPLVFGNLDALLGYDRAGCLSCQCAKTDVTGLSDVEAASSWLIVIKTKLKKAPKDQSLKGLQCGRSMVIVAVCYFCC